MVKDIFESTCSRIICLGVDSLLEPRILQGLLSDGLVKTAVEKNGLIPGEASVALLLDTSDRAQERASTHGATILNTVYKSLSFNLDDEQWRDHAAYTIGRELGHAIDDACRVLDAKPFSGDIYLDLNGENWRAKAWASAQIILQQKQLIDWEQSEEIIPGTSVGDIGVTTPLLHMALAIRSFAENYASSRYALIVSVGEVGDVGVILLEK
ncbi:MAG: hypothetical protein OEZ58_07685 [Gammaproteobacteria bacterium]|nr:hypothetical protein [Gammaproteobacteria bacterium]MDH5728858.1 hypothetical protein [Gammaproteobacteria bacterium]